MVDAMQKILQLRYSVHRQLFTQSRAQVIFCKTTLLCLELTGGIHLFAALLSQKNNELSEILHKTRSLLYLGDCAFVRAGVAHGLRRGAGRDNDTERSVFSAPLHTKGELSGRRGLAEPWFEAPFCGQRGCTSQTDEVSVMYEVKVWASSSFS